MNSHFFKTSSGFNLHFQVFENILPTTTFFIHGNIASNRWWTPTQEVLTSLAKNNKYNGHMICLEFLGCGKSQPPQTAADINMITFANDFNALIENYLITNNLNAKVNLVGHSTGGFIAAAMTALKPDMYSKALLLDPVGAKGLTLDDNIKGAFEMMQTDRDFTAMVIGATIFNNNPATDYFQQVIVEDAFSAVKQISYWVVQAFHNLDATELLQNSTVKTLVLHGEHDNLLSREASEELAVKYLKNAKFEIVPNHGHCMNVENAEAFTNKMLSFFNTI